MTKAGRHAQYGWQPAAPLRPPADCIRCPLSLTCPPCSLAHPPPLPPQTLPPSNSLPMHAYTQIGPGLVVPAMFQLQKHGWGKDQGIPSTVVISASFDDIVAITGYSIFSNVAIIGDSVSQSERAWQIASGPVQVCVRALTRVCVRAWGGGGTGVLASISACIMRASTSITPPSSNVEGHLWHPRRCPCWQHPRVHARVQLIF
jgi:hypothetical protein